MNRIVLMVLRNFWKVPSAYFKLLRYAKHPDKYPEVKRYAHIQYIMETAVRTGNIDMEVYGKENIPKENGFIMYANHQGLFDIIAFAASCDKPWGAVLKKELYKIPILNKMVDCTESLPMDREDMRQQMKVIQKVIQEVNSGRNFLIFPEGTRSKMGNKMLEFHSGSFKCATKTKCTILPVALVDCFKVLDQKGSKPVKVEIHYLKPIPYEEYKDMNTTEVANLVRSRIDKVLQSVSEI